VPPKIDSGHPGSPAHFCNDLLSEMNRRCNNSVEIICH
jgi:hypothetical protein